MKEFNENKQLNKLNETSNKCLQENISICLAEMQRTIQDIKTEFRKEKEIPKRN